MNNFFYLKILIFVINIWCSSTNKLMEKCLSNVVNWVNKFLSQKIWSLWFFLFYNTRIFDAKLECQGYICLQSSINVHAFVIDRCGLEKHYLYTVKGFHKISTSIRLYFKFLKPVLSGIHIQSITIIKEYVFWRIILSVCIID